MALADGVGLLLGLEGQGSHQERLGPCCTYVSLGSSTSFWVSNRLAPFPFLCAQPSLSCLSLAWFQSVSPPLRCICPSSSPSFFLPLWLFSSVANVFPLQNLPSPDSSTPFSSLLTPRLFLVPSCAPLLLWNPTVDKQSR